MGVGGQGIQTSRDAINGRVCANSVLLPIQYERWNRVVEISIVGRQFVSIKRGEKSGYIWAKRHLVPPSINILVRSWRPSIVYSISRLFKGIRLHRRK